MNKRLFFGIFAAAGMLFATSCSNDELNVVQSGTEAQVSFKLGLEGGIDTRAISDGTTANQLMYAVFDKDGHRITTIDKVVKDATFPTTENITLAKGQTYQVAFWAQNKACDAYTVSDDMNVTIDYAGNNNDETRDAFFKTVEFTVTGSTSIDVEMKRPFAQINVGVTKEDWEAAVASGIEIQNSSVVIKNAANYLNLVTGTVGGSTPVSYKLYTIPEQFTTPEVLEVDTDDDGIKEEYKWLSMSYILPADLTTGYENTTLDNVAFVFNPASGGEDIKFDKGLNAVPVRRNWRTNILGKILTGDIQFNITINPIYDGDIIYPDGAAQELELAAKFGGTVTLTENVTLTKALNVTADMILNLNGQNIEIKAEYDGNNSNASSAIVNNAKLTLIGNGKIKATNNYTVRNYGTMVINGATIENGIMNYSELTIEGGNVSNSRTGKHAVYGNAAKLTINGGNFHNENPGNATIFAYGGEVFINDGEFSIADGTSTLGWTSCLIDAQGNAVYTLKGGIIKGEIRDYNKNTKVYGGTYTHKSVNNFVADGYTVVNNGDNTYTVVAGTSVNDATAFITAIQNIENGKIIVLSDDITLSADNMDTQNSAALSLNGVKTTINLNGKTLQAGKSERQKMFYITGGSDVVIENGKLEIISTNGQEDQTGTSTGGSSAVYCSGANITMKNVEIVGSKRGGHRTIEVYNGTGNFENITIGVDYGLGINAGAGAEVTLTNCNITVNGMYSAPYNSTCFSVMGGGKMTVESGDYKLINNSTYSTGGSHGGWVGIIMNSGGTINLKGGTFTNVPTSGFNPQYERPLFTCDAVAGTESLLDFAGGIFSPQEDQIVHKGGSGGVEKVAFKGEIIGQGQYNVNELLLERMTNNNNGTWTVQ